MSDRTVVSALCAVWLSVVLAAGPAFAEPQTHAVPATTVTTTTATQTQSDTYSQSEIVSAVSDFFGVTAAAAGAAVERIFKENGQPNAYIKGEEASGAIGFGLRYGKGWLQMKRGDTRLVYWQGPSIGWDFGANGSKTFTLVYNLPNGDAIYRRFPGVEGSAYFIGGLGVNYQRAEQITLAPMRAGVGLRLGANVGYLAYSRGRNFWPF